MAEEDMASANELTKGLGGVRLDDDYVMVVAIDFGTTFSGYSFSFKSSPDDVKCNREWGNEVGVKSYKTPTCILTDLSDNFKGFGYEAMNIYSRELEADKMYHFYDRFKMSLYKEKIIGSQTNTISRGGRTLPAENIMAMSLNYMKDHILKALADAEVGKIEPSHIRWVLTVPAIWSEGAKQFMRKAAFKAGIVDKENSRKLLIALEPEAASFWCRSLPLNKYQGVHTSDKAMPVGTTYMIVDCGGGTIDLTVHEVLSENTIKEVHRANGGAWGGTQVDEEFLKLFADIFGKSFLTNYKKNYPQDWLNLLLSFETLKRGYSPDETKSLNIPLSYNLGEVVMDELGKSLKKMVTDSQLDGVSFSQGMLVLNPKRVGLIFDPIVSKIEDHITELLKNAKVKRTKYVFLVGGFSESKLLSERIKYRFGSSQEVLVPQDAGVCVMKGAALFGHRPSAIKSRIARKTYGIAYFDDFDITKHDEKKKVFRSGRYQIDNCFSKWVIKNDTINVGETKKFTYRAGKDCTSIAIQIYCTDKENVMYTSEDGVVKIGELSISTPETHLDGANRILLVHLYFGETEMCVRVKNTASEDGDVKEITIDFLSD